MGFYPFFLIKIVIIEQAYRLALARSFCLIRPYLSFHTDIVIEITCMTKNDDSIRYSCS